jgi:hypothetical protein
MSGSDGEKKAKGDPVNFFDFLRSSADFFGTSTTERLDYSSFATNSDSNLHEILPILSTSTPYNSRLV